MKWIPSRFKHNGLFINMFLITVVIIIMVAVAVTWMTIRMSQQFFIEKYSIMNAKVMNQVTENFESFHYSIVTASHSLLQSSTVKKALTEEESAVERMSSYYYIGQQMEYLKSNFNARKIAILLAGKNGFRYASERTYWPISDRELDASTITSDTLREPKRLMYQYDHRTSDMLESEDSNFIVSSRAFLERISGQVYGTMHFAMPESEFRKLYVKSTSPGNNVFVVDGSGTVISSNKAEWIGKTEQAFTYYADQLKQGSRRYMTGEFMGKEQIILMEYMPSFNMYLFNIVDKQTVVNDLIDTKEILIICMLIVLLALIIVFLASRRLTNSLSRMVRQIEDASKHNFHQYMTIAGTYETRQIGQAFNSMLDELHDYVDRLVLAQKQRRNAELAALQQQINPHFLYNTLTSIKFMVFQGERADAEATINALIALLQNTIGNVSETITVKQELDNLRHYAFIQQKRYGNRIAVHYFVAEDCMEHRIPKLILQPFMENSFFHGFNRKQGGHIHVLIWREGEQLICEVADNGDGMEEIAEDQLPNTRRKQQLFSGIGVKNVHERIQLIYGEAYGVTISSEANKGTKVRILLPL